MLEYIVYHAIRYASTFSNLDIFLVAICPSCLLDTALLNCIKDTIIFSLHAVVSMIYQYHNLFINLLDVTQKWLDAGLICLKEWKKIEQT